MKRNLWIGFIFILILAATAFIIDWPNSFNIKFLESVKIHEGLDLQGGTHLVYELDLSKIDKNDINNATQGVINVIDRRINALGVSEPILQSSKVGNTESVIVELPGVTDIDEAIKLIGKTAQLEFWEQDSNFQIDPTNNSNQVPMGWKPTELNGSHLKKAEVKFSQQSGEPEVSLEFTNDGKNLFAEITKRYQHNRYYVTYG